MTSEHPVFTYEKYDENDEPLPQFKVKDFITENKDPANFLLIAENSYAESHYLSLNLDWFSGDVRKHIEDIMKDGTLLLTGAYNLTTEEHQELWDYMIEHYSYMWYRKDKSTFGLKGSTIEKIVFVEVQS
jgi:hypothetical protein